MDDPKDTSKSEKRKSLITTVCSVLVLVFVAAGVLPPNVIPVMEGLKEQYFYHDK